MTHPDQVFDSALHWLQSGRFEKALPLFMEALAKYEAMRQTNEVVEKVCRCRYLAAKAAGFLGTDTITKYLDFKINAEELLKAAVKIAPKVSDTTVRAAAYFSYGEFLVEHGRYAEAIPQLESALKLNDYPWNGWRFLGIAFDETGQHIKAHDCFERALRIEPFNPQLLFNLGVCLRLLKRYNESLETLEQAVNFASSEIPYLKAQAYNEIGVVFEVMNHYDEARENYLLAIQTDPTYDGAPYNLADLLEKMGQNNDALKYWQKAITLDPTDQRARLRLARLRQKVEKR